MKKIKTISMIGVALIGFASGLVSVGGGISTAADQRGAAGTGEVVAAEKVTLTATVKAIDKQQRKVTLQTPDGQTAIINVPPEAKNFDQIKVGDQVRADYLQAVALDIRKAGSPKPPMESQTLQVAPKGEKPSGVMTNTVELTAQVVSVDPNKHLLTLKGPEGNTRTLQVDPQLAGLKEIKPGDQVDVRYTEAVAVDVVKPS
jgi:Cu/Ag efflux protein CusF